MESVLAVLGRRVGVLARVAVFGMWLLATVTAVAGVGAAPAVVTGSVEGQLVADGTALANVTVLLEGAGWSRSTRSNAAGEYVFAGVPMGSYTMRVAVEGFAETVQHVEVRPEGVTRADVSLKGGESAVKVTKKHMHRQSSGEGPPEAPEKTEVRGGAVTAPDTPPTPVGPPAHGGQTAKAEGAGGPKVDKHKSDSPQPDGSGSEDDAEESWWKGLRESRLDWDVPAKMALNETKLMTVRVYGYQDAQKGGDVLAGATGGAELKVGTQMSAELVSVSGDDLRVVPVGKSGQQYVPATGYNDWSWNVTPVYSEKAARLKLTVSVVRDATHSRSFVTYSHPFVIEVVDPHSFHVWFEENFWSMLKYWGPGGAGFVAMAGVLAWWRKRRASRVAVPAAGGTHGGD